MPAGRKADHGHPGRIEAQLGRPGAQQPDGALDVEQGGGPIVGFNPILEDEGGQAEVAEMFRDRKTFVIRQVIVSGRPFNPRCYPKWRAIAA